MERDINYRLIMEVKKHPFLYNFTLPEYSMKTTTDKAWSEIAVITQLSVGECKEKWRNIRSTFIRSKKPLRNGLKSKKPYYLGHYLKFILPFVKPINMKNNDNIPESGVEASTETDLETMELVKSPSTECDGDFIEIEPTARSVIDRNGRKRKKPIPEIDKSFIDYLRSKQKNKERHTTTPKSPAETQMDHFFKSLSGEFESMTEGQIRYFKIQILQLIDKIKNQSPTSPATPLDQPSQYNCSPMSSSSLSHIKTVPVQYYYEDVKEEKPSQEEFFVDDVHH